MITKGYKEIRLTQEEQAEYYGDVKGVLSLTHDFKGLKDVVWNSYVVLEDEAGKPLEFLFRNPTLGFTRINQPNRIEKNMYSDGVKPRNLQQKLAIDLMLRDEIGVKVLTGVYGCGKDLIMINAALKLLAEGRYEKLIWVRNNIELEGVVTLGALPGGEFDKIAPFVGPLADHVGGTEGVQMLIENKKIEVMHLGYIRGRDFKNSIIYVTEGQNTSTKIVKLLLGRVGEGSALWINGDSEYQIDAQVFKEDCGMVKMIESLEGDRLFGTVNLPITERSAVARLASKLDDYERPIHGVKVAAN